jgi:NAD(P)-dependent dehydrogenase (short-subunit alcohol dehydrogenase family)/acyl dehydratase
MEKWTQRLSYDGKVVIITGAANGLGRSHALLFGARGARVVVNDLGGDIRGGGKSSAAADKVVEEIKALGGEAVANYDSVEDGDKIVQTAMDHFGTIDIVINNAGILRDAAFHKMTLDDWNLIQRVHLNGSFRVTHAAWPILRNKGYGRVVMTSSAAGIYGNFGQGNYSAAKLGIFGLANSLAIEGHVKGIHVNTVAPIAGSRLTEAVLPAELVEALKPEFISPLVGWLCHDSCKENGGLFEVGAGYMAKLRWERTRGCGFNLQRPFGPDEVAARWDRIIDFKDAEHPATVADATASMLANVNAKSLGGNEFIDLDRASQAQTVMESSYDERDVALYALGVGAAADPLDEKELSLVYELNSHGFQVLPTYAVMPASNAILALSRAGKTPLPGLHYGIERILHGEQYTEIRGPMLPKDTLKHTVRLKAAYDKAPNAVIVLAVSSTNGAGQEVAYNEFTSFIRGAGGWGGDRGPAGNTNAPPERAPDAVIEERTEANQALLYRLSGDWNPLHADPAMAKASGFDRPVLHGLCTYGYVGRHVVKHFLDGDSRRFKSIRVRFAGSVFPGETLQTRMWRESPTRIVFETRVKERDAIVVKNAVAEFFEQTSPEGLTAEGSVGASGDPHPLAAMALQPAHAEGIFAALRERMKSDAAAADGLAGQVLLFKIIEPKSTWTLDLSGKAPYVEAGEHVAPTAVFGMSDKDLASLAAGKAEVRDLYQRGRLRVDGDIRLAHELAVLSRLQ